MESPGNGGKESPVLEIFSSAMQGSLMRLAREEKGDSGAGVPIRADSSAN